MTMGIVETWNGTVSPLGSRIISQFQMEMCHIHFYAFPSSIDITASFVPAKLCRIRSDIATPAAEPPPLTLILKHRAGLVQTTPSYSSFSPMCTG